MGLMRNYFGIGEGADGYQTRARVNFSKHRYVNWISKAKKKIYIKLFSIQPTEKVLENMKTHKIPFSNVLHKKKEIPPFRSDWVKGKKKISEKG